MSDGAHWSRWAGTGIPMRATNITIPVNGETDPPAVTMVTSRIRMILEAMQVRSTDEGLAGEELNDLTYLLDQVHRVRMVLEGFEEDILVAAHERGASLRTLALHLEVSSPETVRYRLDKIRRAHGRGRIAAAYDEDPMAGEPL